jgi:hypothetical protein
MEQAREKQELLWGVMRYLRRRAHLENVRRLLRPLSINQTIREAFEKWARKWKSKSEIVTNK